MKRLFFFRLSRLLDKSHAVDFLAPLLLRAYLAPVFWMAGISKYTYFESTVQWFGNADWGLGLPFPVTLATLVISAELAGAVCLAIGLGTRLVTVPLLTTMVGAAFAVHLKNGWWLIAPGGSEAALNLRATLSRLQGSNPELYEQMVSYGTPVVLNNGIEFAATYFLMLLVLFFLGAGRWMSVDYWIRHHYYRDLD